MEMENIQRASQFYESYIAKIKSASEGTAAFSTTATYFSQDELLSINRMDIDPIYPTSALDTNRTSSLYPNKPVQQNPLSEKGLKPIEGLDRMLRSGMLHNLVQQYFTLIHPQFMILHKNHFLFRFWAEYGPFPEAYAIHNQFNGKPSSEMNCVGGEQAGEAPIGSTPYQLAPSKSSYRNSPLLLMSMMALVARHLNDRTSMKSTIEEKHHRVMKNLTLFSHDREVVEHRCKAKLQEGRLQELMETDEHGQRDYDGEDFWDRGEQYFNWATELLKAEYEEPSLTAIQSLLLLREYAIMAGNHTQAYMYGGTAITMALGLGWDRSHLFHSSQNEEGQQPRGESKVSGSTTELREEKAGHEKQQENKARDEEQRLCWWQCFIVDRWMSVAFNRPVSIPIHVFDKSHLCPPPKIVIKSRPGDDPNVLAQKDRDTLPMGSGLPSPYFMSLPPAPYRAKLFFDQQCRQALLLDNILAFLSTWSDELFVSPAEFDKLSGTLDAWYQDLADWQKFPFSGIITPERSNNTRSSAQIYTISSSTISGSRADKANRSSNYPQRQESRDVVQSTLLGISFHTIRILLHRPFLRTNLRHPPCLPSRASLACAQSANAITSLAEHLINLPDATVQPCLLMRSQFPLVTAAGIQLMNSSLEDEPRLSTPAKINLLKTIRILRDADRSTLGGSSSAMNGHQGDGPVNSTDSETGSNELLQVLKELFPEQMKHMMSGS
ncbi:hypothetical protein FBU30_010264 [Linnemannia zychae]|nr:hypothetical protein FBU30_010264 [Linnemannia zychae]